MKIGTAIVDLGRGMTYYPRLAKIVGGAAPSLLICALIWKDTDIDQEKSSDSIIISTKRLGELSEETGLTQSELRGARSTLEEKGILSCDYKRLEHQLVFSVNIDRIDELGAPAKLADGHLRYSQVAPAKLADGHLLKQQIDHCLENKRENKSNKSRFALPPWVPVETWEDFKQMRKAIRKPLTDGAAIRTVRDLEKLRAEGQDPVACLDQSIQRGWQGVFAVSNGGNGHGPVTAEERERQNKRNLDESVRRHNALAQ
jgi:hypothetical protein